jgi:hypothetical protein
MIAWGKSAIKPSGTSAEDELLGCLVLIDKAYVITARYPSRICRSWLLCASTSNNGLAMAYDFIFDTCVNGKKLKYSTLKDELTKESLYIDVASSIKNDNLSKF